MTWRVRRLCTDTVRCMCFNSLLCFHHHYHHRHWAAVVSRGWAKVSARCLQVSLSCAVFCQIVSLRYLSRSSLHRLAGLPCCLFLSYGLQVVTREIHQPPLRRLMCSSQHHILFITLHNADYAYDVCPLPDPDVGLSVLVCDVEHTSFHFGLCDRKFVLCLFDQCPGLCTICHSWQHTGVVHLSLQADGNVAFEEMFVVCRSTCHDVFVVADMSNLHWPRIHCRCVCAVKSPGSSLPCSATRLRLELTDRANQH